MRQRWLVAAVVLALGLTLAGCPRRPRPAPGVPTAPAVPEDGGTLYLSMFSAPRGVFNPLIYEDAYDGSVIGFVFNGLLKLDEKLGLEPDLAERFEVSPDNRSVTFYLRRDVRWHDGQPFTARDVAFTFKAVLDPRYPGVRASDYLVIAGAREYKEGRAADVSGIRVLDDYTVRFTLVEPYAPVLERLSFPIVPEHVFRGADIARLADHPATRSPVGTGPYRLVQYRPDQFVELARWDGYYLGRPHIERIIYRIVNQDVGVGQLQAGELDYAPVRAADVPVLQKMPHVRLYEFPSFSYQFMGVNVRRPFLSDKRVRKALAHAINRQAIVDRLLGGHGRVVNSPILPTSWAYDPAALDPYPYDPKRAEEYLRQAGFGAKDAEGFVGKDGRRFEVTLRYPSGDRVREQSAALIQDNLRQVGIKVNLEMLEFSTLASEVFDKRNMDLWLMAWSVPPDPDPAGVFLVTPDNKWAQATGWDHPQNAPLIREGVRRLRPEDRKPIYSQWARLVNDELPYVFLYSPNDIHAVSARVQGLKPDIRGPFWNIHELWIPKAQQAR